VRSEPPIVNAAATVSKDSIFNQSHVLTTFRTPPLLPKMLYHLSNSGILRTDSAIRYPLSLKVLRVLLLPSALMELPWLKLRSAILRVCRPPSVQAPSRSHQPLMPWHQSLRSAALYLLPIKQTRINIHLHRSRSATPHTRCRHVTTLQEGTPSKTSNTPVLPPTLMHALPLACHHRSLHRLCLPLNNARAAFPPVLAFPRSLRLSWVTCRRLTSSGCTKVFSLINCKFRNVFASL
jgi:hypothetical protein